MQDAPTSRLQRAVVLLAGLVIVKVTASVVWGYRDYLPANFEAEFLRGRQAYFFGPYQGAFYAHIAAGPITLLLGLVLISERFRRRFPQGHRSLGKLQALLVLLLLVPSGFWMAWYSESGIIAALGFATLALATGTTVLLGWRAAVNRRFAEHQRWMLRCYLLLCSAVVLRLIGGAATLAEVSGTWSYPLAAWTSWLVPLSIYELSRTVAPRFRRAGTLATTHSASSATA